MPKMNLYLDRKKGDRPLLVMHNIWYKGKRLRISTTHQIETKHWDTEKQLVKRSKSNYNDYNSLFKEQQHTIEALILKLER